MTPKAKPKLDPDVEAFYRELVDSGDVTDQERELLDGLLGKETIQNKFKSGLHAKRRFNQEMDRIRKEKTEFERSYNDKLNQLDSLRDTLSQTSSAEKQKVATLEAAIRQAEAERQRMIQVAKSYAGGEDFLKEIGVTETLGALPPPPVYTPPKEQPKDDPFNDLSAKIASNTRALANWTVDLRKIERDYFALTGKDLDLDEFRDAVVQDDSGDYWKVYNERYDIPRLKQQKAEETMRARLEKEIRDEYDRKYMAQSLPRERQVAESDFFKAIDASIPESERVSTPQGLTNKAKVVAEAVQVYDKLRDAREAREGI